MPTNYESILADFEKREKRAREANVRREREIRGTYADIISRREEGGAFKLAGLADIERTKTQAIGAGTQQMISSGLFGTTTAASIPVQAEQAAGVQRLKLEDILEQRTTEAKLGLAGFVERIEDPYPDYSMLMQAYIAQASQPSKAATGSGGGRGGRISPRFGSYAGGRDIISGGSGLPTNYNPLQDPTRHAPIKR